MILRSILLALFALSGAYADELAFDRYKIIFQKFPFGEPPKEPEKVATPEPAAPPNWINDYRLSMIKAEKVGLVKKTNNASIILRVGQKHPGEGIELVAVDIASSEIKLRKGGEIRSLEVNPDDYMANRKGPSKTSSTKTASKPHPNSKESRYKTFAQRMAERRAALQKTEAPKPPPKPRLSGVELEKHLQNYQMEVIRKGLPPLPVKLTPEMEKTLVDEGVIDP